MSTTQEYREGNILTPNVYFEDQEVLKNIFFKHKNVENNRFGAWLYRTRKKEHTKREDFHWHEMGTLFNTATVAAKAGVAGAGNAVTITLSSADHDNGGKSSAFPKGTLVKIVTATGEIHGRVVAKDTTTDSAHTIDVQPADSTVDLVTATAASDIVVDQSTAKGDGLGWTEGLRRTPDKKFGRVQIFDRKSTIALGEASNMQKVAIPDENGNMTMHYYSQKDVDTLLELQMRMGIQFIMGAYSEDYTDTDADGNVVSVPTSKSLDSYVKAEGLVHPYSAGVFDLDDLDAINDYLKLEGADTNLILAPGDQLSRFIDAFVKGRFDNGAADYTNWGIGSPADKKLDFTFDGFQYGSFNYTKMKDVAEFSYKGTTYAGDKWRKTGFIMPAGTFNDEKTGEEIPQICMRYRKSPEDNRFMKRIERTPKEIGADKRELIYQAEAGLQFAMANQGVKIEES